MIKVGINGFGRIGRLIVRIWAERLRQGKDVPFDIAAVNSRSRTGIKGHNLKYDTIYGRFDCEYDEDADEIRLPDLGKTIRCLQCLEFSELPWEDLGVQVAIEATGKCRARPGCKKHFISGAKRVLLTAPGKGPDLTLVWGVNHELYDPAQHAIISNASCTTNCLAPLVKVLHESLGIVAGVMTTIHAVTPSQNLLDNSHKDLHRARAATWNMIPTTTGAAKAIGLVIPELNGKLTGFAIRVPTPTVSIVDLTCLLGKETDKNGVNEIFRAASEGLMKDIIHYETEPTVSSDYEGTCYSAIFDPAWTRVIGGRLVKIIGWYDNEWGYVEALLNVLNHMIGKGV